ncbi:hypothetical protein B0F90DRAFT_1820888 [Multifurca ochricompacta]|uniref:Uncharacterized protein n=1 Tax=Multifurca ochricompacta TaxID=376703 RepID=A0AAD4LYA6_9AGAM|nr:hypothetical protein B0F90DRAFT_1820888 [Multifurca ochricompacta]
MDNPMGGPPLHPKHWDDDYIPLSSPPIMLPPPRGQANPISVPSSSSHSSGSSDDDPPCTPHCTEAVTNLAPVDPLDVFMTNIQIPAADAQLVDMLMEWTINDLNMSSCCATGAATIATGLLDCGIHNVGNDVSIRGLDSSSWHRLVQGLLATTVQDDMGSPGLDATSVHPDIPMDLVTWRISYCEQIFQAACAELNAAITTDLACLTPADLKCTPHKKVKVSKCHASTLKATQLLFLEDNDSMPTMSAMPSQAASPDTSPKCKSHPLPPLPTNVSMGSTQWDLEVKMEVVDELNHCPMTPLLYLDPTPAPVLPPMPAQPVAKQPILNAFLDNFNKVNCALNLIMECILVLKGTPVTTANAHAPPPARNIVAPATLPPTQHGAPWVTPAAPPAMNAPPPPPAPATPGPIITPQTMAQQQAALTFTQATTAKQNQTVASNPKCNAPPLLRSAGRFMCDVHRSARVHYLSQEPSTIRLGSRLLSSFGVE